jgi:hypothetical protein
VHDALRNFLREINAIITILRGLPRNNPLDESVVERIQELVLAWSGNVRPGLAAVGVPKEVLKRADEFVSKPARLTVGSPSRARSLVALRALRNVLLGQILPELAQIPPLVQAATPVSAPTALLPEISDLPNQLIPKAVQGWSAEIKRFLLKNPFGKNVFVMVSYRASLARLIARVSTELVTLGLNPVVARDHIITDDLYNPIACLLCCSYGVAIFDRAETGQMHNPNVVYELGMMQLLKRPCVILKHNNLRKMPTDLLSKLYENYSSQAQAAEKVNAWWERINRQ